MVRRRYPDIFQRIVHKSLLIKGLGRFRLGSFLRAFRVEKSSAAGP